MNRIAIWVGCAYATIAGLCGAAQTSKPVVPPKLPAKIPGWPLKKPPMVKPNTPVGIKVAHPPAGPNVMHPSMGNHIHPPVVRQFTYRDRPFERRIYYVHGRPYERFYSPYRYRGVAVRVYTPVRYYSVAYYGWAYHPWIAPVPYVWAWAGSPWAAYYGPYFTPYAVYPSPTLWLADYVVASSLQARYEAMAAANNAALPPLGQTLAPATPDVRQAISGEVQEQVSLENYEAQQVALGKDLDPGSSGLDRMLQDSSPHAFVVGQDLGLVASTGQPCGVGAGDVLQVSGPVPPESPTVYALVLASQARDCPKGMTVVVGVSDLQEMQNYLRATVDQGLGELRTQAGQGGLPPLTAEEQAAPTTPPFAAAAPPPDSNAGATEPTQPPPAEQPGVIAQAKNVWQTATGRGQATGTPAAAGPQAQVAAGAWSGDLTCTGGPIAQNAEFVFHDLPAGKLQLSYNTKVWEANLVPGEGPTQRLILRNIGNGPQKTCGVHWMLEN